MIFLGILFVYNAVPAIGDGVASVRDARAAEAVEFKTAFSVSDTAPSPTCTVPLRRNAGLQRV
jgi:hypothetical protein